jgi:hypothetical protein
MVSKWLSALIEFTATWREMARRFLSLCCWPSWVFDFFILPVITGSGQVKWLTMPLTVSGVCSVCLATLPFLLAYLCFSKKIRIAIRRVRTTRQARIVGRIASIALARELSSEKRRSSKGSTQ